MSVTAKWYNSEHRVIIYRFEGQWTWDEYNSALHECRQMLDIVEYGVDLIYDFSKAPIPPQGLVTNFWRVAVTKHHNISGLVVAISTSKIITMLTNALSALFRRASRNLDLTCIADTSHFDEHIKARRMLRQSVAYK